ncbi:MAG: hypothetical protein PHI63_05400 [Patescibacteria group bacterium]|nr:hypothetical protein [Patescibacteria group bacterium]
MQPRSRIGEKFSTKEFHTGKTFRAGSFEHSLKGREKKTFVGKLRDLKVSKLRRTEAANLSTDDLKIFSKLVGERLRKTPKYAAGLPRLVRQKIMIEAEHMAQQGVISREDKRDLRDIVKSLSSQRPTEEMGDARTGSAVPAADHAGGGEVVGAKAGSALTPVQLAASPVPGVHQESDARPPLAAPAETGGHAVAPEAHAAEEEEEEKAGPVKSKLKPPVTSLPDIDFD